MGRTHTAVLQAAAIILASLDEKAISEESPGPSGLRAAWGDAPNVRVLYPRCKSMHFNSTKGVNH